MKKYSIAMLALFASLAACNKTDGGEITSCAYNLETNEKTCNLTRDERKEMLANTVAARDTVKVVDGRSYQEQPDGSLKPIQ